MNIPLIPSEVVPPATAARACSICTSLPEGEKVVKEKLRISYLSSLMQMGIGVTYE